MFHIGGSGGITNTKQLDREIVTNYTLEVQAVDCGTIPKSSTTTLMVIVTDVNDNEPTCTPSSFVGNVPETIAVSTEVC